MGCSAKAEEEEESFFVFILYFHQAGLNNVRTYTPMLHTHTFVSHT